MKVLGGLTLVVLGGGMVFGAYCAGFGTGIALMAWSDDQDKKKAAEEGAEIIKDAAETVTEEAKPS